MANVVDAKLQLNAICWQSVILRAHDSKIISLILHMDFWIHTSRIIDQKVEALDLTFNLLGGLPK